MDDAQFWRMIDETRAASGGDVAAQAERLIEQLAAMPTEELFAFDAIYGQYDRRAYRRDLWAAAWIIGCGCGDDGFSDFRSWLIAQGHDLYERALADPQCLAEVVTVGMETQVGIWHVTMEAYFRKTGDDLPPPATPPEAYILTGVKGPSGLDEAEWKPWAYALFPRLYAQFGDCSDFMSLTGRPPVVID